MTRCRAGVRRRSRMIPGPFPRAIRHRRAIRCRRVSSRPFRSLGSTRRVRQPRLQRHLAHRVRQLPSTRARSIGAPGIIRQGAYHGRCRGRRGSALSLARQFRYLTRMARRRVPRVPPIPGEPRIRHQAYASGPGARPALAPGDPATCHHARRNRPGDRRSRGVPAAFPCGGVPVARRGPGLRQGAYQRCGLGTGAPVARRGPGPVRLRRRNRLSRRRRGLVRAEAPPPGLVRGRCRAGGRQGRNLRLEPVPAPVRRPAADLRRVPGNDLEPLRLPETGPDPFRNGVNRRLARREPVPLPGRPEGRRERRDSAPVRRPGTPAPPRRLGEIDPAGRRRRPRIPLLPFPRRREPAPPGRRNGAMTGRCRRPRDPGDRNG